jgi:hypothetical protein
MLYGNSPGRAQLMTAETANAATVIVPGRIAALAMFCIVPPLDRFGINRTHLNTPAASGASVCIDDRPPGKVTPQSKQERVCRQVQRPHPFYLESAINKIIERITCQTDFMHGANTEPGGGSGFDRGNEFGRAIHKPAGNRIERHGIA